MSFAQPFTGYEILEKVGSGAMGTVFKARQLHMNRVVALKVLKPSLARNERYVDRLRREGRIVGQLNHPNIVTGYDLGEEGGYHYFVMEFVEGQSLRELLNEWGTVPEERILEITIQVAEALDHAFQRGVIHRDVKPGNILITSDDQVKLTDMGLAKGATDQTLTRHGATVGTPQFISPEQARDPQSVDVRSDLYSLGATMFAMATGQPPFQGDTIGDLIAKVLHERAPSAGELNPALGDGLSLVIRKLLAKDPEYRYQTPAELLDDLRRVERAEIPQVDVRRLERADARAVASGRAGSGRSWLTVAGIAAGMLVVLVGGMLWFVDARGDGDGGGGVSVTFVRQLDRDVAAARDDAARSAVFRRAFAAAATPAETAAVRDREGLWLASLESRLRFHIDAIASESSETIRSWVNAADNWRRTERVVEDLVEPVLRDEFGLGLDAIPATLQDVVTARAAEVRALAERLAAARDAGFRQRFVDELRLVLTRRVRGALDRGEFVVADAELDRAADGFFGVDGRPRREQLPDALRDELEAATAAACEPWRRRIVDEQARVRRELLAAVRGDVERLRERLDDPPLEIAADAVAGGLERLREFLYANYPPSAAFLVGAVTPDGEGGGDPWPRVEAELGRLQLEVDDRRAVAALARLRDEQLPFVYGALVERALPARLARLLPRSDELPTAEVRAVRDRHVALLEGADHVLTTLVVDVVGPNGGRLHDARGVVVVRDADDGPDGSRVRVVVRDADGRERPATAREVDVPGVWTRASAPVRESLRDDVRMRRALALWWLLDGREVDRAADFVDGDRDGRVLLLDEVVPQLRRAAAASSVAEASGGAAALGRVLAAYRERDVAALRRALAEFDLSFPAPSTIATENRATLDDVRAWANAAERRELARRELAARLPVGATTALDDTMIATVTLPASTWLSREVPASWRLERDALVLAPAERSVTSAFEDRLVAATHLVSDRTVAMTAELSLPEPRSLPRAVHVQLHGVGVLLFALPNGRVGATLAREDDLRRPDGLARAVGRSVESILVDGSGERVRAVAGAFHALSIELRFGRRRVSMRVTFDGRVLLEERLPRAGTESSELLVMPLQGAALRDVTWRGPLR